MPEKALFEVVLKDGQKFNALFRTGWMSTASTEWLFCEVFGQNVRLELENVASVTYAGNIHHTTETDTFVTSEEGYRTFTRGEEEDRPSVSRFPWRDCKNDLADNMPLISKSYYAYVGNAVFREVTWQYTERFYPDVNDVAGVDQITHRYHTYMTASDYRRLMAQWAREIADREIEYAEG